jgi:predicted SAM-dependent methyltransferase
MSVKLNLGCGNKFYSFKDGWINIDILEYPKNTGLNAAVVGEVTKDTISFLKDKVGVVYNINDLTILETVEDALADEIHAYHVIEHFYVFEVEKILSLWYKKLKPGGKICLELPDYVKCCINALQYLTTMDYDKSVNLGIAGLYGEVNSNNIHDVHKWGWTFKTLKPRLEKVGFINIIEKDPISHKRTDRDFRIEGTKPNV